MDKLRPLIVHRFWIITSLSLILSLVGWSVGTGTLEQRFVEKEGTIKGAFSSLEPLGSTTPNDGWIESLDQANVKEQAALNRSAKKLWERQQPMMYWPSDIHEQMKQYPYMSQEISIRLKRKYRKGGYGSELEKLWKSLDPFNDQNGTGTVVAPRSVIPHLPPFEAAPTAKVMWTSMEDIWLLKGLFRAIRSVNAGARTLADSPIVQLKSVILQGGAGTNKWQAGGQGSGLSEMGGDGCGGMDAAGMSDTMGGCGGGGEGFGAGQGGGFGGTANIDIDLSKDVGSDALSGGGSDEGFSGGSPMGDGCGGASSCGGAEDGCDMGCGSSGAGQNGKRYVDDDPDFKFKTRAFKLHLLMNIDKVPDLLAALNNVDWPVRILRVHQQSRAQEFAGGVGGGMSSMGGGMSSMGGGMSAMRGGMSAMRGGMSAMGGGMSAMGGGMGAPGGAMGVGGGFSSLGRGSGTSGGRFSTSGGRFGAFGSPSATNTKLDPVEAQKARLELEKAQQILQAAMSDPYLAEVYVTGLLTIYQPSETESESEKNADGSSTESTDPEISSPADDQSGQTPSAVIGTDPPVTQENTTNNLETEISPSQPAVPDGTSSESDSQDNNSTPEEQTPELQGETVSPSPVTKPPAEPPK